MVREEKEKLPAEKIGPKKRRKLAADEAADPCLFVGGKAADISCGGGLLE